jgi:putative heme-binding domain-containing protein
MTALVAIDPQNQIKLLGRMLADSIEPPSVREHIATLLAALDQTTARDDLLKSLPSAPERLQQVIAIGLAGNRSGAESLLQMIAAGKASGRLLQLREVELRLERHKFPELKTRIAELTADLPPADDRLRQLIDQRRKEFVAATPDPAAGANVFAKRCGACHQFDNQGAKIGPQLDGIAVRGLDRLLEDIVDPNRNVDQAFRSTMLVLNDGQVISGQVLRDEGEVVVLADQQGKEVRVRQDEIEERAPSQLSLMPTNLADQMPESEFRNLLGYLLSPLAKATIR